MKPSNIGPTEKWCPRCTKVLPLEAFRVCTGREKNRDTYCKACRREDAVNNPSRERTRWTRYRKNKADQGIIIGQGRVKKNARSAALRAHPEPEQCIMPKCANRAHRHHYRGYTGADRTAIIFLCPKHHALTHILERARTAEKETYF